MIDFLLQFTDKLEDILDTLTSTHEMVENAEPISAHPDRIKDQLAEVKVSHPVFWNKKEKKTFFLFHSCPNIL